MVDWSAGMIELFNRTKDTLQLLWSYFGVNVYTNDYSECVDIKGNQRIFDLSIQSCSVLIDKQYIR